MILVFTVSCLASLMVRVLHGQMGSLVDARRKEADQKEVGWLARWALILALIAFGVFYLMLSMGGAGFINGCQNLVCGQLHQAVFAAIGAVALFVAAFRLFEGTSPVAQIIFFGTLPILIVHVLLVVTDPNEAIFFPLSTTPPPLVAGAVLLSRER